MSQFPDFVVETDTLHISCSVNYTGSLAPGFEWNPRPDRILPVTDTGSSINSTVEVIVPPGAVQPYTCTVTFNGLFVPSTVSLERTSTPVNTSGK